MNAEAGKDEVDREKGGIPPFGNFAIIRHQFCVNIGLFPQRTPKMDSDGFPEVQDRMRDGGRDRSEGKSIRDCK